MILVVMAFEYRCTIRPGNPILAIGLIYDVFLLVNLKKTSFLIVGWSHMTSVTRQCLAEFLQEGLKKLNLV